jgi:DNA polymerase
MGDRDLFFDQLTRHEALVLAGAGYDSALTAADSAPATDDSALTSGDSAAAAADSAPAADVWAPAADDPARSRATEVHGPAMSPGIAAALPASYGELRGVALACTRCRLAAGRTQVVFSDGVERARLMVVGEAPGATEDETGLPFVGAAGKLLDLLLATVGLSRRESVYICNVIKCRPPGNRNPLPDEIEACSPYLRRQIELIAPEALLAVGSFAAQLLTGSEKTALGRLRGDVHSYQGVPLVVTYHPAALLRNPKWTRAFWDDLQLLRNIMDGA